MSNIGYLVKKIVKPFFFFFDDIYNQNRLEQIEKIKKWELYKKMLVGSVDSIEPPDGYDQARLLTLERGFDLWCKESM